MNRNDGHNSSFGFWDLYGNTVYLYYGGDDGMKGYLVNYGTGYEQTTEERCISALEGSYYDVAPLLERLHQGEDVRTQFAVYRYQE